MGSSRLALALSVQLLCTTALAQTVTFDLPSTDTVNRSNVAFLLFGGTCSNVAEQVTVTGPSGFVANAFCGEARRWEVSNVSLTHLPDGSHTFTASHLTAAPRSRTLRKDTVAPSLSLSQPTNGSSITADNQFALAVRGSCSDLNQVVSVVARPVSATTPLVQKNLLCSSARTFATTLDVSGLPDGDVQISVQHRDAAGNFSQQDIVLYKDVEPILVSIGGVGSYISAAQAAELFVHGTCNKPGETLYLDVSGESGYFASLISWCAYDQTWSFPNVSVTDAPDEELTFTATLTHSLTGGSAIAQLWALKDVVAPTFSLRSPTSSARITSATGTVLEVSGTCNEPGTLSVRFGGATVLQTGCDGSGFRVAYDLAAHPDGDIVLSVQQSDAAGNAARQDLSVRKDVVPATLTVSEPTSTSIHASNAAAVRFSGTCSEYGAFAQPVELEIGDSPRALALCMGGEWSTTLSLTELAEGAVSVRVSHGDVAGNPPAVVRLTLVKDTVAPLLSVTAPAPGFVVRSDNAAAVVVSGTCDEEGREVSIVSADLASATCSGGRFAATLDVGAAPDGDLTIRASLTDAGGNRTVQDVRILKDTTPPRLTLTTEGEPLIANVASAGSLFLMGSCSEHSAAVSLTAPVALTASCDGVSWSLLLSLSALPDGRGTLELEHRDIAGNLARVSRAYLKDTVAPHLSLTVPAPGAVVRIDNAAAFTVAGSCDEDGRQVELSGPVSASAPCSQGTFAAVLDLSAVSDGDQTIRTRLTDAAGNVAIQDARLHKDTTPPTLELITAGEPLVINASGAGSVSLFGACSEDSLPIELTAPVRATAACTGTTWALLVSFADVADGSGTLTLEHRDAVGNVAATTRAYTKDTVAPQLALSRPVGTERINLANRSAVTVSGTCNENGRPVELTTPVARTMTCDAGAFSSSVDVSTLADGVVTFTVRLSDAAGNATTRTASIQKDTVTPTLTLSNTGDPLEIPTTAGAQVLLQGTCSESGRPVSISSPVSASVTCNSGAWSYVLSAGPLPLGSGSLQLAHTDAAGNPTSLTRAYVKRAPAPVLVVESPAPGASVSSVSQVSGTCSINNSLVEVLAPSTASVTCFSGRFAASVYMGPGADGPVTLKLRHKNASGDAVLVDVPLIKDTVGPTLVITPPVSWNLGQGQRVELAGNCSEPGQPIDISGSVTTRLTCADSKTFAATLALNTFGTISLRLVHKDAAGNVASASGAYENCAAYPPRAVAKGKIVGAGQLVKADFNGDGLTDLATPSGYDQYSRWSGVRVQLANPHAAPGSPAYLPATNYTAGAGEASSLVVADFNMDGALDIATTEERHGSRIFTGRMVDGRPDGTFNAGFFLSETTGIAPEFSFVRGVEDINDDGSPDLLLMAGRMDSQSSNTVNRIAVAYGGPGCGPGVAFSQPVTLFVAPDPSSRSRPTHYSSIAVGDFDGNGQRDVAALDAYGYIDVARRTSPAGTPPSFTVTSLRPSVGNLTEFLELRAADLNADSRDDLVYREHRFSYLGVTYGRADGSFSVFKNYPVPTGTYGFDIADMNADGSMDLLASAGGVSAILPGRGAAADHSFGTSFGIPATSMSLTAAAAVDVNRDGIIDIATWSPANGTGLAFTQRAASALPEDPFLAPKSFGAHDSALDGIVARDFNADGLVDLGSFGTTSFSVMPGNGDGTFGAAKATVGLGLGGMNILSKEYVVADFNSDGALDVVVHVIDNLRSALGNRPNGVPDGTFGAVRESALLAYSSGWQESNLDSGDIDGDGILDLVMTLSASRKSGVLIRFGAGDGTFPTEAVVSLTHETKFAVAIADFNADGRSDVLALPSYRATNYRNEAHLYLGTGSRTSPLSAPQVTFVTGNALSMDAPLLGDFNADGIRDVIVAGNAAILYGQSVNGVPTGTFAVSLGTTRFAGVKTDLMSDVNGDGWLDFAASSRGRFDIALRLPGAGEHFASSFAYRFDSVESSMMNTSRGVAVDDFNQDGVQDVAVADGTVKVLLGRPTAVH